MDTLVLVNFLILALIGSVWSQKRCYVCSGKFPDRDCELYPQYVTMGPGKVNCTMQFCTVIARYKPKKYLLTLSKDKKLTSTSRPLTHADFELDSIARECENLGRGNSCKTDPDALGITCYSSCKDDLCNKEVPKPTQYDGPPPSRPEDSRETPEDNGINAVPPINDDLPESYSDSDSPRPNDLDYNERFPPPLQNDTEAPVQSVPDSPEVPSDDEDGEDLPKTGPGRRGPPRNTFVGDYEGQGSNKAELIRSSKFRVLIIMALISFIKL